MKGGKKLNTMQWLFLCIGLCFISYYFVMKCFYTNIAFSSFFLFSGASICLLLYLWCYELFPFTLPKGLLMIGYGIGIMGICIFLLVESIIVYHGYTNGSLKGDYIMVLGAGLNGKKISTTLRYRLDQAILVYQKHPVPIIVTGGKGAHEEISEAQAMRDYLIKHNIEKDMIIIENQSTDTNENFVFTKKILNQKHPHVILITNRFHMLRAEYLAKKHAFICERFPAKAHAFTAFNFYVREFFGMGKDVLLSLFH